MISFFSASTAWAKAAFAAVLTASKSPLSWTALTAASPAVLASATLSAFSAAAILASSSVFLASTALTLSAFSVLVKLLSALISFFSASTALARSNFALAFCKRSVCALISAWFLRFAISTLFVSSFKITLALATSAW